jgi:PAS domain S-box-containing protein
MDTASEKEIKILIAEGDPADAEMIENTLRKGGLNFSMERVTTRQGFADALDRFKPDIVLSDYKLPDFHGLSALKLVRTSHQYLPVIEIAGFIEEVAIDLIKAGASDYVLKDRLARLPTAVRRAIAEAEEQGERDYEAEVLHESAASLREAQRIAEVGSWEWIPESDTQLWSEELSRIFGRDPSLSPATHEDFLTYVHPDDRPQMRESMDGTLKTGAPFRIEVRIIGSDGETRTVDARGRFSEGKDGRPSRLIGTAHDITESKRAERVLLRLNRTLRVIHATNVEVVRATTEEELLDNICRVGVDLGGYRMVWIGFVEQDEAKTVRPVAWAGEHLEFVQTAEITWADTEWGRGPTGTAIRTGETQINQNFETNPVMALWRAELLGYGFKSSVALPLKNQSEVFGVITLYAGEQDAFVPEEVDLLREMVADLAYGVHARRGHVGRDVALASLDQALKSTVQAVAGAVEMHDVYTAGHQRHVADLAVAIAREIGLTEWQIEGIFLAGTIHDVGKLNVPAEFLSKPGKLTPLEYQVIQTHVQSGYDVIKGVNFPWPVAQSILQHHERLDGSGYPNRLKGEAISMEGRILTVADVVDAMQSHRPYRPALGLDAALAEIEAGKGRLYDPAVVDACTVLFRQKGFKFD